MNFNSAHPARFGQARRHHRLIPDIKPHSRHCPVGGFKDQVRRTAKQVCKIPLRFVRPLLRRRYVFRITLRDPGIDPFYDRVDLRIRQRAVILKLLDADGLVDMPWWHLASEHAFANSLGPGAHAEFLNFRIRGTSPESLLCEEGNFPHQFTTAPSRTIRPCKISLGCLYAAPATPLLTIVRTL